MIPRTVEVKKSPSRAGEKWIESVNLLRANIRGRIILQGDIGYEEGRRVWNGMIDRYPAIIAQCIGVSDVIEAVKFARTNDLLVAVRGGGHNVAGNAVCDDGIVIDLSQMKGVRVDPRNQTARAEGGVTWGEFDQETQVHGLATTGGLVSSTGIAGFTLGGGIGWLMRKYGLACDNLLSADIVTPEGEFLTTSAAENKELYWGLRGGGGNFGIVTSFEYKLHPVGPLILGGMVIHPMSKARELLAFYLDFVRDNPMDELTTLLGFLTAPPLPFIPIDLRGKPVIAIVVCYIGPLEEGERILRPLREFGSPAADVIQVMPYRALQSMLDGGAPSGLHNYWKSDYLRDLTDPVIETIIRHSSKMTSPFTQVHLHQMGGMVSRISKEENAFSHRDAAFVLNIISMWNDPSQAQVHTRWARDFWDNIHPYSVGVYVNFLGEEGDVRVKDAYGHGHYERLVELKDRYDPTNFLRLNQNIKPSRTQ